VKRGLKVSGRGLSHSRSDNGGTPGTKHVKNSEARPLRQQEKIGTNAITERKDKISTSCD
jgi:hypothetical protein